MNAPPGWGSLPCPGGTSKLLENSPRRTVSLGGASCNPLMALLDTCARILRDMQAFTHLFPHRSQAFSHVPWQKEALRHREAEAVNCRYPCGIPSAHLQMARIVSCLSLNSHL